MDLHRLRCFVVTAEQLNFSNAANLLFISQPSLSYQIAELERELGVKLFYRDKRKVILTAAGEHALPIAKQMVSLYEKLEDSLIHPDQPNVQKLTLRIAISSSAKIYRFDNLRRIIRSIRSDYPASSITVDFMTDDEVVNGILTGNYDAGYAPLPPDYALPAALESYLYQRQSLYLVSANGTADLHQSWQTLPVWLLSDEPLWNKFYYSLVTATGLTPETAYASPRECVMQMLLGNGSTPMTETEYNLLSKTHPETVTLPLASGEPVISYYVLWSRDNKNAIVASLLNHYLRKGPNA